MKVYHQYRQIIKDEPLVAWMSENYHLRFLQGFKWNAKVAATSIINAEQKRL